MDVSADGGVVVGYSSVLDDMGELVTHAFRWTRDEGIEDLGMPEHAQYSRAIGISDDGQTVLVDALMLFMNDDGEVIATPNAAFIWQNGEGYTQIPIPPEFGSMLATAISADGTTVVGRVATPLGVTPARASVFRWRAETGVELLEVPPELNRPSGTPWGVNADGSVMVGALIGGPRWIPFIWDETHGFRTIEAVLTEGGADYSGWEITGVNAVSADGRTIVGTGFRDHPEFGLVVDGWIATISDGTACPADWDGSGTVNSSDISAFLTAWLDSVTEPNLVADFDGSGAVNSSDISAFLTAWLQAVQQGC